MLLLFGIFIFSSYSLTFKDCYENAIDTLYLGVSVYDNSCVNCDELTTKLNNTKICSQYAITYLLYNYIPNLLKAT